MVRKMSVDTSITQNIDVINDKLACGGALTAQFQLSTSYETYVDADSIHPKNIGLNPLDHHIFAVPINVLPPPPHKIVSNIIIRKKDTKTNPDAKSPETHEENCTKPKRNDHKKSDKNKNAKNNAKTTTTGEKPTEYTNHSPNVYHPSYYDQPTVHLRGPRFYTNRCIRTKNNNNNNGHKNYTADNITRRAYGLMERFKSRSYLMRIDTTPEQLLNGGPSDHLNQAIWDVFVFKAQKETTYISKLETWKSIFLSIKSCLHNYGLFIVGSTMSGFGLESSDIDMCLLTKPFFNDSRLDAVHYLEHVKNILVTDGIAKDAEMIVAKVPILKFQDVATGFEVDLNCNNGIGIQNTHLLHCYARLDWRVRPMVVITKIWAQTNNINDAKNMTISSYSLALMVINYLQCGVTPPVLPCLHGLVPEIFNSNPETGTTDVQEDVEFIRDFKSDNTNCLGDLLIGFLNYYSHFNFAEFAISVRTGSRLPIDECRYLKAPKNDINQWKFLCIEEPFNFSNTARSVFDAEKFKFIKDVLMFSYWELSRTKNLNAILPVSFLNQR